MWRLVIRIFPLVLGASFAASFILVILIKHVFAPYLEKVIYQDLNDHFSYLEKVLTTGPREEFTQRYRNILKLAGLDAELQPVSALPPLRSDQQHYFDQGHILIVLKRGGLLNIDPEYYYRIYDTDQMLHIQEPVYRAELFTVIANLFIAFVLFLVISVWAWLHWSELKKLMQTTNKISQGDFSARTRLSKYASTWPLANVINQMASYIQQLITSQRDLIHSVSHELRTPITRLEFSLTLLQQDSSSQSQLSRIENMQTDLAELNTLVSELLQLTTLKQPHLMHREHFDLLSLLQHCQQRFALLSNDKEIILRPLPEGLSFYGDKRLIERMLNNLLQNALRYANKRVWLGAALLADKQTEIQVWDDGPGIPAQVRQRVFEPFYRLEKNWDKSSSGYGLGLAIVAQVVELHQGTIEIMDALPHGARFVLRFRQFF